ncbi:unnamed protein product [Euphydryas editha]|uniref:Transposase n=1 Tax=Euphydryas editha TaxID=104508 RepID=A0AAU9TSA2_EUPED|nr:unnamed protein product [Euphydryas editha]
MTVHWIYSATFARHSSPLVSRRFKRSHTFDKIAELIIDYHSKYDLRLPEITKTVTDNGKHGKGCQNVWTARLQNSEQSQNVMES